MAYIIDTMYGNCTVKPIQQTFDTKYVDKNHLKIRNAREFFYFDVINYTYQGVVRIFVILMSPIMKPAYA